MALIATQLPADFADNIAKNAGVIMTEFEPSAWAVNRENILGATTGGINFSDKPEYSDFGEDIDNCPKNTMELKEITGRDVKVTGTFVSANPELVNFLIGAGSLSDKKITPSDVLSPESFKKVWLVVDYGTDSAVAIEMSNALSTGGFTLQTADKAKGTFAFEFTAHYSIENPDTVPYAVHFK